MEQAAGLLFSTIQSLQPGVVPHYTYQSWGGLRLQGLRKVATQGLPLITVITIVMNNAKYVERTILSVLNQTYRHVEYILVDGGSIDGTVEIIKKYERYLDVWISEPDKGTHDALNKGASLMTGEYVIMLHSGDCFNNTTVLEDIFLKQKIYGDVVYGNFIGPVNEKVELALYTSKLDTKELWQGMAFCHQAMFTKLYLIKKFPFDTKYKISSDFDFVMKCNLDGAIFQRVDVIVARIDTIGISFKYWFKARLENWEIGKRFKNDFGTNFFHLKGLVYDVLFRAFKNTLSYLGFYSFLKKIYRKTLRKKIKANQNITKVS